MNKYEKALKELIDAYNVAIKLEKELFKKVNILECALDEACKELEHYDWLVSDSVKIINAEEWKERLMNGGKNEID